MQKAVLRGVRVAAQSAAVFHKLVIVQLKSSFRGCFRHVTKPEPPLLKFRGNLRCLPTRRQF